MDAYKARLFCGETINRLDIAQALTQILLKISDAGITRSSFRVNVAKRPSKQQA